jgi:hypothetical protein
MLSFDLQFLISFTLHFPIQLPKLQIHFILLKGK